MDSLEAPLLECSVVGTCLLFPDLVDDLDLRATDFTEPLWGEVFGWILQRRREKKGVSMGLVQPMFRPGGRWAEQGEGSFISLKEEAVHPEEARTASEVMRDMARKRALIRIAHDLERDACTEETAEAAIAKAEQNLKKLDSIEISAEFQPKAAPLATNDIAAPYTTADRLPSGWPGLDRVLMGWPRGKMSIIAARPSVGKSMLAIGALKNQLEANRGSALISLEMDHKAVFLRMAADLAYRAGSFSGDPSSNSPTYSAIKKGTVSREQRAMFEDALSIVRTMPLMIDDRSRLRVTQMHAFLRRIDRFYRDKGSRLDFVVVDYLQLAKPELMRGANKVAEITDISADLTAMFKDLNVAGVALSQLSRLVEQRDPPIPVMSDLRESGAIEQDAEVIALLYRPAVYWDRKKLRGELTDEEMKQEKRDRNRLQIDIAKNREGEIGAVDMFCAPGSNAVRDMAPAYRVEAA